ncbi:TPM domain-containing protein [bacterium SCSIO 12643]|nr:TPM domain-containing protein [bacterium SCSIO 12643]
MKLKIILTCLFAIVTLNFHSQSNSQPYFKFPDAIGYVNDFEGILKQGQIDHLNRMIVKHEKLTTNEIAIVTIESYAPYKTLFDYSLDLGNYWGTGKAGKNNGILIVFGKQIREVRIQVGKGLEDKLTNEEAKYIIDQYMVPKFKKGKFYTGIKKGLVKIMKEIK